MGLIDTVKALKDVGTLFRGKADAGIADAKSNSVFLKTHRHVDPTGHRGITECIDQEVREDLHGTGWIGHDQRKVLRHMDMKFKTLLDKLSFKWFKCALDEVLQPALVRYSPLLPGPLYPSSPSSFRSWFPQVLA